MAASSLLVNAFAPFVPGDVRRRWRRQAGEDDGGEVEPPGTGGSPAPPKPPPVPSPRSVAFGETSMSGSEGASVQTAVISARATADRREGQLPGFPARLFWLLVAAALIAGGLSCLVASVVLDFGNGSEDLLICVSAGVGLVGFSGFALYRGLWARKLSFWGRTVRPFLLVTAFNATAVSAACFTLGPTLGVWKFGEEETVVSIAVLLGSAFLFGVLLVIEKLTPRLASNESAAALPRHQRPVPALFRVLYLCLGAAATIVSLVLLSVGTLALRLGPWEHFGALSGFVVAGVLGLFLFRQGLRRRRGHLWSGVVRPFLLGVVSAAIGVSTLPFLLDLNLGDDETVAFIVLACFAGAFGVFVFFLRGPDEAIENPLLDRFRDLVSVRQEKIASSWLGLGTVLWILGVGLGLASVVVGTGLSQQLPLQGARMEDLDLFFRSEGPWLASLLLLGGGVSIVLARLGTGIVHVGRGIIGQVALLASLFLLATAGGRITVASGFRVHADLPRDELLIFVICGLLSGAFGALLLAWPPEGREHQSPTDTMREEVA